MSSGSEGSGEFPPGRRGRELPVAHPRQRRKGENEVNRKETNYYSNLTKMHATSSTMTKEKCKSTTGPCMDTYRRL